MPTKNTFIKLMIQVKKCSVCTKVQDLCNFTKDRHIKCGLRSTCKTCDKSRSINRKEYIIEYHKNNKIAKKEYDKKYRTARIEQYISRSRLYYKTNKIECISKQVEYMRRRLKTDVSFRVRHNLRTRLSVAVTSKFKKCSLSILLGCSIQQVRTYLESKFTEGMTWANYGKGHIDHVKPCALFDLSKIEEQMICFNYTNLQPLWAKDNLKKGAKYRLS